MSSYLEERIIAPVANPDDVTRTVRAVKGHLDPSRSKLTFVNVIEKGGGAIDKAPVEAQRENAEDAFAVLEAELEEPFEVDTKVRYGTDVVEEIIDSADEMDATAILFVPRPGGTIARFLSGNITSKLVNNNSYATIVLPRPTERSDG